MSKKLISTVVLMCFATSCLDAPPPAKQITSGDKTAVLPVAEEPPAPPPSFEGDVSAAASDCLDCLGSLTPVCVDETVECVSSLSCNVWVECTEGCVARDADESCYTACDDPTHEFFTPQKMKKCSCEVCYAQCLNMCPAQ